MKTLKTQLLAEVNCRNGLVEIPALVEAYGDEVKATLWQMRYDGEIRLQAYGDPAEIEGVNTADCIQGDGELFVWAEKVTELV